MTVRKHEPITIRPDRILRVEAHDAVPDRVDHRRQRHRRARVSGLSLLDGVNRKRANGVDTQLIDFGLRSRFGYRHDTHVSSPFSYWWTVWGSSEATLAKRRRWRGAWLNSASRNVTTRSHAMAGPTVRPPIHIMFMWSSSTPCRAEKWSCTSPARMVGILFAQTDAPTPLPQTATPRSTVPTATARASGMTKSG